MARKKQRILREPADESQEMTFIALMLLLFCFMVILVSMQQSDAKRFRKAIGSVRGAFSILNTANQSSMVTDGKPGMLKEQRSKIREDATNLKQALQSIVPDDLEGLVRVEVQDDHVAVTLGSLILFDPGDAELSRDAKPVLDEVHRFLSDWPGRIKVVGHSDDTPIRTALYPSNWELSVARASAAVRFFEEQGIDGTRLVAEGVADRKPLTPNDTEENRALNRRLEILLECLNWRMADPDEGESAAKAWLVEPEPI